MILSICWLGWMFFVDGGGCGVCGLFIFERMVLVVEGILRRVFSVGGNVRPAGRLAEQVAEHAVPQFGFKPRAFWRQDAVLVGNGYQVGDAEWMEGEGDAVWGFVR